MDFTMMESFIPKKNKARGTADKINDVQTRIAVEKFADRVQKMRIKNGFHEEMNGRVREEEK